LATSLLLPRRTHIALLRRAKGFEYLFSSQMRRHQCEEVHEDRIQKGAMRITTGIGQTFNKGMDATTRHACMHALESWKWLTGLEWTEALSHGRHRVERRVRMESLVIKLPK